jgi:hypothetical protein
VTPVMPPQPWPLRPLRQLPDARRRRPPPLPVATRYRYRDGAGEIGIVASVTQPFCRSCTRARLSAEGMLYTCLFAGSGHDLRAALRGGASDRRCASRSQPSGQSAPTATPSCAPVRPAARRKWRCRTSAASKPPGPATQPATRTGPARQAGRCRAGAARHLRGRADAPHPPRPVRRLRRLPARLRSRPASPARTPVLPGSPARPAAPPRPARCPATPAGAPARWPAGSAAMA